MTQRANARSTALVAALAGLALSVWAGPAWAQSAGADPKILQRPEWSVGDWWEGSGKDGVVSRVTVVGREGSQYVLARSRSGVSAGAGEAGTKLYADQDGWVTKTVDPSGKATDSGDKYEWVRFPLEIGNRWSFFTVSRSVKGVQTYYSFDCRAAAWETVEIGGRAVRALRIDCLSRNRDVGGTAGHTAWYAPETKRIVRLVSDYQGGPTAQVSAWGVQPAGAVAARMSQPAPPTTTTPADSPQPSGPTQPLRVERPTYKVGDKWIRSDGAYELTRIDRDVYVFTAGAGKEFHLTKDLGVARIVLDGRAVLDVDAPPKLAWPLEVGKWGGGRATLRTPPPRPLANFTGSINVAWRVEAYEDVPTAAGSFKAFRITQKIETLPTSFGSGQQFGQFSLWYAPDVQRFVKAQGDLEGLNWELAGVGAPAPPPVVASPPAPSPQPTRETPRPAPPPPAPIIAPPPADTEAPKIAVNYPGPDTKVEREQIVVLGLVTDNVGVDRVQITVNGVEVAQPRDIGVSGKGLPIRVPAALQPGENVIEITATDKAGNVAQVVRTVTRVAAAVAAPPGPKVANRWAVVIGVGEYEHKAIPRLRFAARDAQAMYDFLTTKGGYPKQNVLLLTDTTAEKPTLQNIRRALGDFLFRRPGRDDMVLIYYAGHGAPEVDAAGAETDGLSKYLIPRNADPDSLYSTAFPMDEIQKIFARIPAERVVMLLDTCYSGTAGGRTFARQQIRSGNLSDQFLERLTRSRGRVVITASGPNEVALESPELGHGIFTYYLLEGLAGKADRNGDGLVTVSELYEYVEDQVERKAREAGGRQRPLMKGEIEGTLPLSRTTR